MRQRTGMEGASATEGNQSEIAWIVSALHRNYADRFGHGSLNNPDDASGEVFDGRNRAFCLFHPAHHAFLIQLHGPAKEARSVQPPQRKVRVGYSWLFTTPKTDRSWYRPSRLRPDTQHPARVKACNRAATRSSRVNIKHRNTDGYP